MTHQSPNPKYAIVNSTDCPKKDLVAEWVPGVGYCYMARAFHPYKKQYDGMDPARPTAIEDFGFTILEREYQTDFYKTNGPTVATYGDGKPRVWQDHHVQFSLPRVDVADVKAHKEEDTK